MKNHKSLVLIVTTVMLFSFAAAPPANAFVGMAALGAIIAATFASAVLVNETVSSFFLHRRSAVFCLLPPQDQNN